MTDQINVVALLSSEIGALRADNLYKDAIIAQLNAKIQQLETAYAMCLTLEDDEYEDEDE